MSDETLPKKSPLLLHKKAPMFDWELPALLGATLIGFVLRIFNLGNLPGGMWYDEGLMGQGILRILYTGEWPIYFYNNGLPEEALSYYLSAISVALFGHELWAYRLPNALIGTLTIPALYWAGRQYFTPRVVIIAVIVLATMRWHVHFSRLGFRTLVGPFFCVLIMGAVGELLHRRSLLWATIAGILMGLSLYTYIAMRLYFVAVLLSFMIGILLTYFRYHKFSHMKREFRPPKAPNSDCVFLMVKSFGIIILMAILVFLPLLIYFYNNPEHATARQDQISLRTEEGINWSLLTSNARDVALMGIVRGDDEIKHNLPGYPESVIQPYLFWTNSAEDTQRWNETVDELGIQVDLAYTDGSGHPAFDLIAGLFFYAGLVFLLIRSFQRQWSAWFLLIWLLFGSAASVLSVGAPNYLRTLLLTPMVAFTIAIGLYDALFLLTKKIPPIKRSLTIMGLSAAFLLWFAVGETYRYFIEWKNHPDVYGAFNQDFTEACQWMKSYEDADLIVIPNFVADFTAVEFLTYDDPRIVHTVEQDLVAADGTVYYNYELEDKTIIALEPHEDYQHYYPELKLPEKLSLDKNETAIKQLNHPLLDVWAEVYPVTVAE